MNKSFIQPNKLSVERLLRPIPADVLLLTQLFNNHQLRLYLDFKPRTVEGHYMGKGVVGLTNIIINHDKPSHLNGQILIKTKLYAVQFLPRLI